jgi:hypothetical protein
MSKKNDNNSGGVETQFFPGMSTSVDDITRRNQQFCEPFEFLAERLGWDEEYIVRFGPDAVNQIGEGVGDPKSAFNFAFQDFCRRVVVAFNYFNTKRRSSTRPEEVVETISRLRGIKLEVLAGIFNGDDSNNSLVDRLRTWGFPEPWLANLSQRVLKISPYDESTLPDFDAWMDEKVDATIEGILTEVGHVLSQLKAGGKKGDKGVLEVCEATGTLVAFLANWGGKRQTPLKDILVEPEDDGIIDIVDPRELELALSDTDFINERDVEAALAALALEGSKGAAEVSPPEESVVLAEGSSDTQWGAVLDEISGGSVEEEGWVDRFRAWVASFGRKKR